jgi:large subunit ribosomal protein L4e
MTSRPVVSVYNADSADVAGNTPMPTVFSARIRDDLVQFCHSNMAKNRRQAHGVYWRAGGEHSAESWGTGRAVARIPRISGSGTHRSGQATFGNMCRKARMFAPLRTWRKWHRKVNLNQKRNAVASALAAAACGPLVMARGHKVDEVPELPLVIDGLQADTTKGMLKSLNAIGLGSDMTRVRKSKRMRPGMGKMRTTRFTLRKGPLVVYGDDTPLVKRTARNLPGVDTCNVTRLNLLQLAPGGHLGRLIVFTKGAFEQLDALFGTFREKSARKANFQMGRCVMSCADLARIINSDQVQSKLRDIRTGGAVSSRGKKNPLTNRAAMQRLNPAAADMRKAAVAATEKAKKDRAAALKVKRSKKGRAAKAVRSGRFQGLRSGLEDAYEAAHQIILDEIAAGEYNGEE